MRQEPNASCEVRTRGRTWLCLFACLGAIGCGSGEGPVGSPSVGGWEPPTGGIGGYENPNGGSGGAGTLSTAGDDDAGGFAGNNGGGSVTPVDSGSADESSNFTACGIAKCSGTFVCNTGTVVLVAHGDSCVAQSGGVTCTASSDCSVSCGNGAVGTFLGNADGSFTVNLGSYSVNCPAVGSTSGTTPGDGGASD
jgi:hypothetical protein